MDLIEVWSRSLFLAINGQDGATQWLVALAVAIGEFVIYLIPALLLWMWLCGKRPRRELAVKAFVVTMLAVGLNQIIPMFWQHPRPFAVGGLAMRGSHTLRIRRSPATMRRCFRRWDSPC